MAEAEQRTRLESSLYDMIRCAVREELATVKMGGGDSPLLTPEELAARLSVPVSWVYEQSRMKRIPAIKIGKYIRFNLAEVLESQKNKNGGTP